jgi:hypothetical protein
MFNIFNFRKKKMNYIARFLVDVDNEKYPQLYAKFMFRNIHINFKENLKPPNQAEFVLGPFERNIIDKWMEIFRSSGCNFKMFIAEYDLVKDKNYFL